MTRWKLGLDLGSSVSAFIRTALWMEMSTTFWSLIYCISSTVYISIICCTAIQSLRGISLTDFSETLSILMCMTDIFCCCKMSWQLWDGCHKNACMCKNILTKMLTYPNLFSSIIFRYELWFTNILAYENVCKTKDISVSLTFVFVTDNQLTCCESCISKQQLKIIRTHSKQ